MDKSYRILIVDDEVEICDIIERYFSKKGFEVLTAYSGEEALTILGKETPDLMILDKKMPGVGGLEVLRELKRRGSTLPVIVLSGSQDLRENIDKFGEMGYRDILKKPVDLNVLLEEVDKKLIKQNKRYERTGSMFD